MKEYNNNNENNNNDDNNNNNGGMGVKKTWLDPQLSGVKASVYLFSTGLLRLAN